MEYKKNNPSSKVEKESIKFSYSLDSTKNINPSSLEYNKPAFDKENNKYSLITFLSSKRKPDVYLNDSVIKAKQYRTKQSKEEEENIPESDPEAPDMKRTELRYFNTNLTIKCFNCGEVGHMSRNCPHDEIIICTRCNERGHDSFNCFNMKCFKCNRIGHRSFECKLKDVKRCEKCGHNGHVSSDCLSKADNITDQNLKVCRFCGDDKHLICPFPRKMYIIEDYDSDNVIFSEDEEAELPSVKRERRREKMCPRCAGDHILERCKVRPPNNSFDNAREQFKRRDDDNRRRGDDNRWRDDDRNKFRKRNYRSDSEDSFSHFRKKSRRYEDYRFNSFK
jgi:hypothetical protein